MVLTWLCKKQKYMMLTMLVSGPKQPGDRIDDLKILWKLGVLEVWDEYKREEFTMHGMLLPPSTTTRLSTTSLARVKGKV
jgi:hypothetical protein